MRYYSAERLIKQQQFKKPIVLNGYPCNLKRLWKHKQVWSQEFKFNNQTLISVKYRLKRAFKQWKEQNNFKVNSENPLTITVHVRRTDYPKMMNRLDGELPGKPYFSAAFKHYQDR